MLILIENLKKREATHFLIEIASNLVLNEITKNILGKINLGKLKGSIMEFVGRVEELKELKNKYNSDTFETIIVSGKRRMGKSQLIFESYQDFVGLVVAYECYNSTYQSNLINITERIRKAFDNDYLSFNSLHDVIIFLHKSAYDKKILFFVDEYPYMREGDKTDSEIKNAIDEINTLKQSNPLKIILCGSAIDVMKMLDNENKPLHGRFTAKINVDQLNYLESSRFFPKASLEDKVAYYSVLGGVPYYLKQIDDTKTFKENIVHLFFSSSSLLASELESHVNYEINKIEKAPFVLDIIRSGTISYSDIKKVFNNSYPEGSIDYVLEKLSKIETIEKIYIHQDNSVIKPYYRIKSNALMFYYSFVNVPFGNKQLFSGLDYYEEFIESKMNEQFIPHRFEIIGQQFVSLMNKKGFLQDKLVDLFPYIINDKKTKSNYQFDVVGKTSKGLINYECKYQNSPIGVPETEKEKRQAELANNQFYKTVFISKSEVADKTIETYYLNDLFSETLR